MKKPWMPLAVVFAVSLSLGASCASTSRDRPAGATGSGDIGPDKKTASGAPTTLFVRVALDINSGDFRLRDDSSGSVETTISESRLSKEVRRLGICVPETRNWQAVYVETRGSGMHVDSAYPHAVEAADLLLDLLVGVVDTDEERRVVLEKFMATLRAGNPLVTRTEGYILALEIADKYGLASFLAPEVEAGIRQTMMNRRR